MKAVVYRGARHLGIEERDPQPPGHGELRIAVAYTGICGTDLHIYHGDMDARVGAAAIIGHEMSGRIAAVGEGATGWSVGQAVTVMPTRACGRCAACRNGNSHICHAMNFLGIDSPGAMQSLWNVPAELVLPLPAGLPLDHAALVEPVAVAVHDVRRANVTADEQVVVVGGGPVGVLIAVVAQGRGARVLLVEPDAFRRALAGEIGIEAVDPGKTDVVALVDDRTAGAGADVAFEVSGSAAGVATAVDVLTTRGRLVLVAIHPQPREVNLHRFFWRELELLGARLYQRDDMAEAIRLVASGVIPARQLISRVEPVEAVAAAFDALAGGGVMKVLLDLREDLR
ncbi:2-desacetyl-2-hydroxyethyl bacteriochlorophyllide A dehydrogenase [Micromonospora phaseoli]|uniref:2-desacetyl-2-hydroxyethyl bacteriochlorophyllide A dehydrogenase n=1 Tax=Micromonospora phaseoli TaxID=1144548 RepID=A0A1H6Z1N5_9ACTN|nr:alcohol dehydrogenase catalytic domain-containing protein [Micromonospora phaseoli]PZW00481.1 2-desacetyl-2-hydroxyethyl bacteriochlorophyllide A dehydrogenase [Micromonospora phaseoli]GIJ80960.1 Zn-dependent alcohol dehydrogenase [Micromonospora phaseoli]SEJ45904.1 2-desacetyl-2-hydroxyethyl bacteriochlorophyllide A dehydrogenase [Micromonospora phaseoli]